jgi:hypothetical protein
VWPSYWHAPPALDRLEVADLGQREVSLVSRLADAPGDHVLGVAFNGGGQRQRLRFVPAIDGRHLHHPLLALGERTGLAENHRL